MYPYHAYYRLQQFLARHIHPCHFNGVGVPRWARCQEVINDNIGVSSWWASHLHQIKVCSKLLTTKETGTLKGNGYKRCTRLKWVADWTFRTGCMRASLTIIEISAPEYPSVFLPRVTKSDSVRLLGVEPRWSLNMKPRACSSGSGM